MPNPPLTDQCFLVASISTTDLILKDWKPIQLASAWCNLSLQPEYLCLMNTASDSDLNFAACCRIAIYTDFSSLLEDCNMLEYCNFMTRLQYRQYKQLLDNREGMLYRIMHFHVPDLLIILQHCMYRIIALQRCRLALWIVTFHTQYPVVCKSL